MPQPGLKKLAELDFDNHVPDIADDDDWWRQQDQDMEREEQERIEQQADEDYLRRFNYWD